MALGTTDEHSPVGPQRVSDSLVTVPPNSLSTGDSRRIDVVAAAIPAFAKKGFHGVTTTEIAKQAGISQPYLYRLYRDKTALFVAVLEAVKGQLRAELVRVSAELPDSPSVDELREALTGVLRRVRENPEPFGVLLQATGAVSDPVIRRAVIECYRDQVQLLSEDMHVDDETICWFIAAGHLVNAMAALRPDDVHEPWIDVLLP